MEDGGCWGLYWGEVTLITRSGSLKVSSTEYWSPPLEQEAVTVAPVMNLSASPVWTTLSWLGGREEEEQPWKEQLSLRRLSQ